MGFGWWAIWRVLIDLRVGIEESPELPKSSHSGRVLYNFFGEGAQCPVQHPALPI
jgi:hypothetical protein